MFLYNSGNDFYYFIIATKWVFVNDGSWLPLNIGIEIFNIYGVGWEKISGQWINYYTDGIISNKSRSSSVSYDDCAMLAK